MSEFPSEYKEHINYDIHDRKENEIDLRNFFLAIWEGKWIIFTVSAISFVASISIALSIPNIYVSEALLAPTSSDQRAGPSGLAGQLGGLASLAGVNLSGGEIDRTIMTMEVMKSREFIGDFINSHKLVVPLMAAKGWDPESGKLILDDNLYDSKKRIWVRKVKPPREVNPSSQEAYDRFIDILKVSKDPKTGLVRVSVEYYSPYVAKQWVDWFVEDINKEMKSRDLREAKRSIDYLNSQLEQTRVFEMKSVLYQLIEEQTKTIMFAEVRDEYAFKSVDPAIAPELKSKPSRALICVLITAAGGMLAILIALIRHYLKNTKGFWK